MLSCYRHLATGARLAAAVIFGLSAVVTPAAAQFGGLKKKAKAAAAKEATPAPSPDAGMIVFTPDVVNQLLAGLAAGKSERDAATKENTPYGRYKKAQVAYVEAKPKCEAAQPAFYQRGAANPKLLDKYQAQIDKMSAAQEKGDRELATIHYDSAMAVIDPSCIVKEPVEPENYNQAEREAESRAEAKEVEASGFSAKDLAMVKERAIGILNKTEVPGGASASEKSAVTAKAAQLKPLLGIREEPAPQVAKPAPAAAAAPAPSATPQPSPEITAAASKMSACMMKNMQTHEAEIEALSIRAEAAEKAGNQQKLMAIADTLQRIQMAGCR